MGTVLLVLVIVLVVAALVFGVASMLTGDDPGLSPVDPDGRALPLPNNRSLAENDLKTVRFDVTIRGYRMSQVDRVLRRTAYDVGYKDEMIAVLEAEVAALRDGRAEDADLLRKAREAAANPTPAPVETQPLAGDFASPDLPADFTVTGEDISETDLSADDAHDTDDTDEAYLADEPDGADEAPDSAADAGSATDGPTEEPAGEAAERARG
jgi:DivIVA domain-containing protein